ncbi:hypothetical protein FOL47_001037 [Perkinsus chesapeaki]|uniref:Uncharacterized protein n=1 Tax=Perkinsus chesapeaki TaxID=330153 RepID=A0A7J6KTC9_PERCH|nr:hypothetical protein FOL47_001037 [Perkinsus chesapeaki]
MAFVFFVLAEFYSKASYTSTSSNAGGNVNSTTADLAVINIAILTDSIEGDEALIGDVCRNSRQGGKIHGWLFNREVRVCGVSGHNPEKSLSSLPDNAVEMENLSGIRKWADMIILSCPPVLAENLLRSLVECYRQSLSVPSVICLVLRPDYTLRFDRRGLLAMSDITTCTLRPNGLSAVGVVYHDGMSGYAIGSHDSICSEMIASLLKRKTEPVKVDQVRIMKRLIDIMRRLIDIMKRLIDIMKRPFLWS